VTLDIQIWTMASMMLSGVALGMLYDAYRVVSGEFRFPRWTIPPLDILYWAVGTIAVFRVLYLSNGGEVRLYVFLALMIGVSGYFAFFSGLITAIVRFAVAAVKQGVRWMLRLGDMLLIRPIVALYRLIVAILGFFAFLSTFLFKFMLQLLYPLWKFATWAGRALGAKLSRWIGADRWLPPLKAKVHRLKFWQKRK
jgi:spore cortex biosynthesis protein YabQ